MAIMMPASDQAVLDRRDAIVAALRAIVPGEGVIDTAAEMLPYESDGLMAYRQPPMVVVLPDTTEQVSQVLKYCCAQGIKVVPRGSGTSLSGGALPSASGSAPPAHEVPEPRGTTLMPWAQQYFRTWETCSVVSGSTTTIGGCRYAIR